MPPLTLDTALAVRFPGTHKWAPTSRALAFLWEDGGAQDLWWVTPEGGEPRRLSAGEGDRRVTDFDWRPDGREIAYVEDGDLYLVDPEGGRPRRLMETPAKETCPRYSPDGARLAFERNGALWIHDLATGGQRQVEGPGKLYGETAPGPFSWAPDGDYLACAFRDEQGLELAVVRPDGTEVWRSGDGLPKGPYGWAGPRRLWYWATRRDWTQRGLWVLDLPAGPADAGTAAADARLRPRFLLAEEEPRGLSFPVEAVPSPGGDALCLVLGRTGWDHLYRVDLESGQVGQLTDGDCEDVGHAYCKPQWSPDGRTIAFSSNRVDPGHRHLFLVDVASGSLRQLTAGRATDAIPKWSPDGRWIAYCHTSPWEPNDLWVLEVATGRARQLTRSLPPAWGREQMVEPEHVTFEGAHGWTIHGYLYRPPGLRPGERVPALVWVHGGPVRQMRDGWHPLHGYAVFYAFHQYLAHQGFASLWVNYRSGIGYGRAFEQGNYHAMAVDECADVVAAGRFLKSLDFVDPARVGVWGISYGGYLTLAALTKHPDVFACGVNVAGIWDFDLWQAWASRRYPGGGGFFRARLGDPAEHPEVWKNASPKHWVAAITRPSLHLHGTADEAVPFEQLDAIVRDLVAHEKPFETVYYPDETHVFTWRRTWKDAFPKVEAFFRRHLG